MPDVLRERPTDWTPAARVIVEQVMKMQGGGTDYARLIHGAEDFVSYVLGRVYPDGGLVLQDPATVSAPPVKSLSWQGVADALSEGIKSHEDGARAAINWVPIALIILQLLQQLIQSQVAA